MKFVVHFVPYRVSGDAAGRIQGTDWDEIKEAYADAIIERLSELFLPGLRDHIICRAVQSPLDFERRITSARYGTHQHGAYLPYQICAADPRAWRVPFADFQSLSVRCRQSSGVGGHHGARAQCRQSHLP